MTEHGDQVIGREKNNAKMVNTKESNKHFINKKYILALLGLFIILICAYLYQNTTRFHENDKEAASGPTKEDIDYDKFCSLLNLYFDAQTQDFELHDYKCSKDVEFQGKILEGQEATVDILTSNYEEGKSKFREWLRSQGLQESDKLRITYVHKPK